jgi:dTMP kinase
VRKGLFITFEGMDGCGKTTQMHLLAQRLQAEGYQVLETAEPGGTRIGNQIRRILLHSGNQELCPIAELLLYFASRAQNVEELILPALREGKIVLSDRFTDSTLAYQGAGRGLGEDTVITLDRISCQGLAPDLTIIPDIDLETSLARARERNRSAGGPGPAEETRMDEQAVEFYGAVRDAYARLAAREPQRVRMVDGGADVQSVARAVWEEVAPHLGKVHV